MANYLPDRGDVIWLDFDPSAGAEIQKRRPALVLSTRDFNRITNFAMVAPITSTVRGHIFEVALDDCETKGVVVCHQAKSLAFGTRNAAFIEMAPETVTSKAVAKVRAILD
ncbi:type II toxin-antitoxin system PemK/MazF family toxin [Salmonella enterica subsp. enterica serovar Saintpaul]|nr:type II toxin-antitoxin system PemK/MazF family toxin [Salmonella enterica subsp. enterica serovar Saintpaul]